MDLLFVAFYFHLSGCMGRIALWYWINRLVLAIGWKDNSAICILEIDVIFGWRDFNVMHNGHSLWNRSSKKISCLSNGSNTVMDSGLVHFRILHTLHICLDNMGAIGIYRKWKIRAFQPHSNNEYLCILRTWLVYWYALLFS